MSKKKKTQKLKIHPSSYRLSFGSLSSSTQKFIDREHKKLLPEILVTEDTERPLGEKTPKSESLDHDEVAPSQSPPSSALSSSKAFPLSSFSFSSLKSAGTQFKSSASVMSSSTSSKSEEEDYRDRLKSVVKVTSGLSFPSTSGYSEESSSSSIYVPVPVPVPAKQLESKLLAIEKSLSLHRSTQTKWQMDNVETEYEDIESVTTSYEKLPSDDIKMSLTQNQEQTMTTQTVKPPSPLLVKESSSTQGTSTAIRTKSQGTPSPSRTYQSVFKCILQELLEREEKASLDIDVSPSARLRQDTRRKLAYMFKTNFERYKDVFRRILKKRKPIKTPSVEDRNVINIEEYRIIHVPEESPVPSVHELVVMDEEWLEEVTKAHRGSGVPTFYKGPQGKDCVSKPLSIFFPDGTGQIYYPSGNIALIISHAEDSDAFTYMIFKDDKELNMQALINNLGHATFYDKEDNIRMCLGLNLGFYFDAKGRQKAWNWWDPNQHIHAPPYQSIYFDLNPCIGVHIKTQDKVLITINYYKQKIHLNLGTKVKVKDRETEMKLQSKPILEIHKLEELFQQTNSLLKKMKSLCCLTKLDLENFIKGYPSMTTVEEQMRAGKLSVLLTNSTRGSTV
ncbi:glutamate-rich protein 6B [Trichosurus vulpecula]|uniref:glutamate-rich protein 6B n=1 Tax=Trichosurus vulpecula TaxID=9337 RepID=UPI00186B4039|nr:glutamate-rich protein 6B [Trichosurus vulpecula]